MGQRLENIRSREKRAWSRVKEVQDKCNKSLGVFDWQEGTPWNAKAPMDAMLFTKGSANKTVKTAYSKARPTPALSVFDEFRDPTKPPCLKLYSDLDFFFNRWRSLQEKQQRENKEKRKRRKKKKKTRSATQRKVRAVKVKKYNKDGELIVEDESKYRKPKQEEEAETATP